MGVAGDFSDWAILELMDLGGLYVLPLHLEQGIYRYKFIVDGEWMRDPANPALEADPFGGVNSVLHIGREQAARLNWKQIAQDPSILNQRMGHYFNVIRAPGGNYELRFNWFPGLDGVLSALIDDKEICLIRVGAHGTKDVYHCMFSSEAANARIMIKIRAEDEDHSLGADGFGFGNAANRPWVVDLLELPVFSVPDWVGKGVVYQIFPDRFCNGDPALNPDFSEWYYADSRTLPQKGEYLAPFAEYFHLEPNWKDCSGLRQSPWQPEGKPDWWSFYGGDLPGVISKLDYLSNLGVTILYFNPLWQAKSNHKYDAAFFDRIDPHFGTLDEMRALVSRAHDLRMKIIVDVAFNHTGEAFWAFRDCVLKGPESEYWNWYDWNRWPLPNPLPPDFQPKQYYQCWWGIKDMPDLNYDLSRLHPAENYVRSINKAVPNEKLVEHILCCVEWWLTEVGIDGFRLDVPDEVPFWFWELFRAKVKEIKPDAWIVGEIWHSAPDWIDSRYCDSLMNYAHFKDPVVDFFVLRQISKQSFITAIESGLAQYPAQAARAMMNLLGSHDTQRILQLADGNVPLVKVMVLVQMTFMGAPHIYYGDEIALLGGRDPDNRRPFDWDWEQRPEAVDLAGFYREMIALRKSESLLQNGEFAFLETQDGLIAYQRYDSQSALTVFINYSQQVLSHACSFSCEPLLVLGNAGLTGKIIKLYPLSAVVARLPEPATGS